MNPSNQRFNSGGSGSGNNGSGNVVSGVSADSIQTPNSCSSSTTTSTSSSRSNSISRNSSSGTNPSTTTTTGTGGPGTGAGTNTSNNWLQHSNCLSSISLKDSLEFEFQGNINQNALELGDCDNDEKNELVLGTLNGELLIFKDSHRQPLATTNGLGMVACILIGDILNVGWNCIVSLSIEGYLKIFHLNNDNNNDDNQLDLDQQFQQQQSFLKKSGSSLLSSNPKNTATSVSTKLPPTICDNEIYSTNLVKKQQQQQQKQQKIKLNLLHFQQIQSNAIKVLLVDLDQDGKNEFLVALSDRVVRCYRTIQYAYEYKLIGLYKWEFSDQICSICLHYSKLDSDSDDPDDQEAQEKNQSADNDEDDDEESSSTTSSNRNKSKLKPSILVSQFGGVFAKITLNNDDNHQDGDGNDGNGPGPGMNPNSDSNNIERTVEYNHSIVPYIRNPQTNSHLVSNLIGKNPQEDLIALATIDGTVILFLLNDNNNSNSNNSSSIIKWRLQLEYPILSMSKFDINFDNFDELIICTWNGLIYLLDLESNFLICYYHEPISSFVIGKYHLNQQAQENQQDQEDNSTEDNFCLIGTTFTNSIKIFYNLNFKLQFQTQTKTKNNLQTNHSNNDNTYELFLLLEEKNLKLFNSMKLLAKRLNILNEDHNTNEEDVNNENEQFKKISTELIRTLLYEIPR